MNSRNGRLRSQRSVVLLLAALVTVLAVGAGVLWLSDRGADEVHLQGEPMTDAQAAGQVVASAKQIVSVGAAARCGGRLRLRVVQERERATVSGRCLYEFPLAAK